MQQSRRLSVAYVASRYPKHSETFVFREIAELERQGHTVLAFAFTLGDGADVHPDAGAAAHVVVLPAAGRIAAAQLYWLGRAPRAYLRIWRQCLVASARSPRMFVRTIPAVAIGAFIGRTIAPRAIRHVHAHWATHPTTSALVASRLADVPFSFTAHAHDMQVDTTMLAWKLRCAAFAVTVSDFNRRALESLAPDARVEVVRSGIDPTRFPVQDTHADDPEFRICCIARLAPEKGQEHLLRALAELARAGRPASCAIVGAGQERQRLERLSASLGLTRVVFHGSTSSEGVRAILAGSDAMVLPSVCLPNGRTEGLPVALVEAMSVGVPVVASRVAGTPELVRDGETGLLVEPGSAPQIAHAIARLMDDPVRARRMGREGKRLIEREHDLTRSTSRLATLFGEGVRR
jgi:colanic acid/amylovoran biosynthesis glycosyltransferase